MVESIWNWFCVCRVNFKVNTSRIVGKYKQTQHKVFANKSEMKWLAKWGDRRAQWNEQATAEYLLADCSEYIIGDCELISVYLNSPFSSLLFHILTSNGDTAKSWHLHCVVVVVSFRVCCICIFSGFFNLCMSTVDTSMGSLKRTDTLHSILKTLIN